MLRIIAVTWVLFCAVSTFAQEGFQTRALLPKEATGAAAFLEEHPEYDGRNVVVAIFDTGVDPGAPGLQQTPSGKPKIVDIIDGTGSGDVDTSTILEQEDGTWEGLSGRTLKIDPAWTEHGKLHAGLKRAYDFFPPRLIARMKRERREAWDKAHAAAVRDVRDQLDAAVPEDVELSKKEYREELQARLAHLKSLVKDYDDPGPVYDCVVFFDGEHWRAAVDTDEDGDLVEETLLTNYRTERQHASFGDGTLLNFAVNIYEEGEVLSICVDANAHATHVAGIVAGYHPERPELNGLAPGAQIVSVKIGDSRLGSMETAAGLERGLAAVLRNHCDLINMSYSEPTARPDSGRLPKLFNEVVNEHGVIFVSAAANDGPALSTAGATGAGTSAIIGVGAYVSSEMMRAQYAMRENGSALAYTWSSRGPLFDGSLGVSLFAPGGAIAPIPEYSLRPHAQMNGTSMASPNACGSVAVLLSALKATETSYSPHSVRRALENTAEPVDGVTPFAQGMGMIQVGRAFDDLREHAEAVGERLSFDVHVTGREGGRGILLREPAETSRIFRTSVSVRPRFRKSDHNGLKGKFDLPVILEASEPWIEVGGQLLVAHGRQSFDVGVDPRELPPGAHYAEIRGLDAARPERGPIFRVPVTVIKPEPIEHALEGEEAFEAGTIRRRFVVPPPGATWAELHLDLHGEGQRSLVVHAVQRLPGAAYREGEFKTYVRLRPGKPEVRSFAVQSGRMLELCLAQNWSSEGESHVHYRLEFRGVQPSERRVMIPPGERGVSVDVQALLGPATVAPSATFDTRVCSVPPVKSSVTSLSPERDRMPGGAVPYLLQLTYEFELDESATVTPRFPFNEGYVYDSAVGPHLWHLYDNRNRRLMTGDVYRHTKRLKKGKYRIELFIRNESPEKLNALKNGVMLLERKLGSSLRVPVLQDALPESPRFTSQRLEPGEIASCFLQTPALPSSIPGGETLVGTITYADLPRGESAASSRPGGFEIRYVVPNRKAAQLLSKDAGSSGGPKTLREFQLAQLKKIPFETKREEYDELEAKLLEGDADDLEVHVLRLERLDTVAKRKERLDEIVAAADAVIEAIDREALVRAFGTRAVTPEDRKAHSRAVKEKATLVDALYRKGRALGYMELPDVIEKHPIEDPEAHDRRFKENFAELQRWVDTTEPKYVLLHVRHERRKQRWGIALKLLTRTLRKAPPNYWYFKKRRDLYEKLGWEFARRQEHARLLEQYPPRASR